MPALNLLADENVDHQMVALLLTADRDFGELVFRQHRLSGGVILFRLLGITSETKARLIASAFTDHSAELAGDFTVISPGLVRIGPRF